MRHGYRTKTTALALVLSLIALVALTGCGGGATETKAEETKTETKAEAKPAVTKVDFESETVGESMKAFSAPIGNWVIADDGGNKVLMVDGTNWKKGDKRADVAERVEQVFGSNDGSAFLANVQQYSDYPISIFTEVKDFKEGEISMRFKAISGNEDQCAGILFDVKPNGDYLTIRANPRENNINFFELVAGKRNKLKEVPGVATPQGEWATWKVVIEGTNAKGYLNDKLVFESPLKAPVSGRVGIWSKSDSKVMYDDYTVTPK